MQEEWDEETEPDGFALTGSVAAKAAAKEVAAKAGDEGAPKADDDSDDDFEIVTDEPESKKRKREDDLELPATKKPAAAAQMGTDADPISLD